MIIDLLRQGNTNAAILAELHRDFPTGTFSTSNAQALAGTKWELRGTVGATKRVSASSRQQHSVPHLLNREELVGILRSFKAESVIQKYRRSFVGKKPGDILASSVDHKILRAFRIRRQFNHERPSERYNQWRWHGRPEQLLRRLEALKCQADFDRFALAVGESLAEDWGERNEHADPTGMNIGIAMKMTNVVLKHLSFSSQCHNLAGLIQWLHVPWDSFTLTPLRGSWTGIPRIPRSPGQGFVQTLSQYRELHSFITGIAQESRIHRIIYEFWAWDGAHQG